ncbi:receptor-type tyrosine-protein phosphatase kappa-like isoform X3 [Rhopilema esculentum]|uniref:receptor-type tyrosine-protein phosphatase kappa-like isoform X3 n=1 Tax=Rhopilema esculentum TaxID=499914 RepID=UPI0031D3707E
MTTGSTLFVNILAFVCFHPGYIWGQRSMPNDCHETLLQTTASSLSLPQHTSSCNDTQLGIKSSQAWISGSIESVEMTYLKVDLGTTQTITGIQTLKFPGTFQILFGYDGNSNFTYRNLNGDELFQSATDAETMHFLCPTKARFVYFVPEKPHSCLNLITNIYGCNATWKSAAGTVSNLQVTDKTQNSIKIYWNTNGLFDRQLVSYKKVNSSEHLIKTMVYASRTVYSESIVNLEPCTKYELEVAVESSCNIDRKKIIVKTNPSAPTKPTIVSVTSPKPFTAVVTWTVPSSSASSCSSLIQGFIIKYRKVLSSIVLIKSIHSTGATEYTFSGLEAWQDYEFVIHAASQFSNSAPSNKAYVQIDGKAPEQPVKITFLQSNAADAFTVSWTNPPLETVNGQIKNTVVYFKKKSETHWKMKPAYQNKEITISPLTAGNIYQVRIALFNNKYKILTDIKEIFVGRKAPALSSVLTNATHLQSNSPGRLLVSWKIPSKLNEEKPEKLSVKLRKVGEVNWKERITPDSATESSFDNLEHWRIYECVLTLYTSRAVYYTKIRRILITGTTSEKTNAVRIETVVSNSAGSVELTISLPRQFAVLFSSMVVINCFSSGIASVRKIMRPESAHFNYTVRDLVPWRTYSFEAILSIELGERQLFGPSLASALVIGKVPGKPPADVRAVAEGTTSIRISWKPIPNEYARGTLHHYSVFYSTSTDSKPKVLSTKTVTNSLLLTGLESETMYFIQICGTNSQGGIGPLSVIANATTWKDPRPPSNVKASTKSSTEALVMWAYPPDEQQRELNFSLTANGPGLERVTKLHLYRKQDEEMQLETKQSTIMDGLKPSTSYIVTVTACKTKLGVLKCSDPASSATITTFKEPPPPTPTLSAAVPKSSAEIEVSWNSPVELKETTLNFTVIAEKKSKERKRFYLLTYRSLQDKRKHREYSKLLSGLEPFTAYKIHVVASKKRDGRYLISDTSNEITVHTKEAAPSAPLKLDIQEKDDEYVFTWQKPSKPNGVIRRYLLNVYHNKTGHVVLEQKIPGDEHVIMIRGDRFSPYQQYRASLKARTVQWGPLAEKVFITAEGYPTAPRGVSATFNGTHLLVNWKRPKEENGKILRYKVNVTKYGPLYTKILMTKKGKRKPETESYEASPQRYDFVIQESNYGTKVRVEVAAVTSKGDGPSSGGVVVSIDMPKPNAPPQPEVQMDTIRLTTMVVKLKPMLKTAFSFPVSLYQVIVEVLNGGALKKRSVGSVPDKVSNYSIAVKNSGKFYIAAEFEANNLPDELVLGNGKVYNGYHNAPLNPETLYKVHVRAVALDGNGNSVYGEATSINLPRTAARKAGKSEGKGVPLPIIAGIAGALLILVILVVIIILYLRSGSVIRRRSKDKKEPYDIELSKLRPKMDSTQQRPASLTGDFPLHPDHAPVTFANYGKYVAKMHRSENTGFRVEYAQLEMGKEFSWENAHQPENKPKNRFANIVAYDHARVILRRLRGDPTSDYINASYIDGYMKPNGYVATQGPLPGTFNDFWRMVWELRSSVIVMLTNLQEKNKLKCHKYWPDDCIEYGDILVTLTRKEIYADYSIRTFLLEMTNSQESREVKHFHFTVWPDHGVPKYATAILAFRRRVRSYQNPDSGPTLVHCSAGVGRTGTYIALDAMLDRMNGQSDVDIFNFVAAMRTRRIAMVQTEEQYIFIHDALLESVQCGNTEITAQDLRIMINRLETISPETNMTGFEKEWKILNNVSPIPPKSSCNTAALPENMAKNRNQNACTLPADNSLVRLLMIEDDEATAYINAVYVDGYKQRNAFILTQSPLKNTVMDFWRMLCEHKSAAVVLLSSPDEGEDFVKFWPDKHIREYEMITVECLSKAIGSEEASSRMDARRGDPDLIIRQFRVEDTRNPDYPMMVKMFQFFGWTETKVPANCSSIIHLINQLERWQQQSGNGPVTIICSDGIGRSGTFAALNAAIERVKVEQVVDVFQAIKAMRIQRAHVVKTLDQYRFVYNSVEEYLNAFGDYANFK